MGLSELNVWLWLSAAVPVKLTTEVPQEKPALTALLLLVIFPSMFKVPAPV